jgi:ATP-dependent DNA ligase I
MLLAELVACSKSVAETRSRKAKIEFLTTCIRALAPEEVAIGVGFLAGTMRQGRIGLGYAAVMREAPPPAERATLSIREVDALFARIQACAGVGSQGERARLRDELLGRATAPEQAFLRMLLVGELRQGALEGIVVEAVARAAGAAPAGVRRATMLSGDLGAVAEKAMKEGDAGLAGFSLTLFQPLQLMLAQTSEGPGEALEALGEAALEWKLDGARVQVHKSGDDVAVYSRRLNEVTHAVPEVVDLVRALPARELLLDGEVIALKSDGTPQPFQATMRRFGRKLDVEAQRREMPLHPFFFDVLHADGETLLDAPASERFLRMDQLLPEASRIRRVVTADPEAADAFLDAALEAGHEGIMAKALASTYAAGRRGAEWLKIKPAHTLDLVVLGAEWGHGRRRGFLSNLHLGARNDEGAFTMLGKTFKGMTDEMLRWQTQKLEELAIGRDAYTVYVRPELVVEIALNDVQESPHYPGGLALRFARVKRYRPDKRAEDADTMDTVRRIHAESAKAKRRP